jgi:nucleoside-triphosphatase THEP1
VIIDILTGQVQSGKTTLLQKISIELDRKGIRVGGFLSLSVYEASRVDGYDLYDIEREMKHPFLRKFGEEGWERTGPYFFIPDTLALAKSIVLETREVEICFVDEVGPAELRARGIWPALAAIHGRRAPDLFLTVRASLLDSYLERLGKKIGKIFDVKDEDVHPQIIAHLEQKYLD